MVEHLLCKQGVIGSNPIVSTSVLLAFHGMVPTSAWLACPRERGAAGWVVLVAPGFLCGGLVWPCVLLLL